MLLTTERWRSPHRSTLAIEAGFDTVTNGFAMTAYMIGNGYRRRRVRQRSPANWAHLKATMVGAQVRFIALFGPHLLPLLNL